MVTYVPPPYAFPTLRRPRVLGPINRPKPQTKEVLAWQGFCSHSVMLQLFQIWSDRILVNWGSQKNISDVSIVSTHCHYHHAVVPLWQIRAGSITEHSGLPGRAPLYLFHVDFWKDVVSTRSWIGSPNSPKIYFKFPLLKLKAPYSHRKKKPILHALFNHSTIFKIPEINAPLVFSFPD